MYQEEPSIFSAPGMNFMRLREQASALHLGEINDSEYLKELVNFIIRNRDQLSPEISHSLSEAFGKRSSRRESSRSREDALNRVHGIKLEDIKVPECLAASIPRYNEQGDLFWTEAVSTSTKHVFNNVLSELFYAHKRHNTVHSVRRAFYCVALYRVIRRIMELHGSKTFTSNIAKFCADMIAKDSDIQEAKSTDIVEELKSDYKVGGIYDIYTQKEGSGILFYLFVLPPDLYEKYLNKGEDVDTVISHYRSIGFQQESTAKSAAASIMGVIAGRLNSQVSIFRLDPSAPQIFLKNPRKRGKCQTTERLSKRGKSARKGDSSRCIQFSHLDGSSFEGVGVSDTHPGSHYEPHCLNTSSIDDGNSTSSRTSADGFQEPTANLDVLGSARNAETAPHLQELATRVDTSFQQNTDLATSDNTSLALSVDAPSNAARLTDGSQLEPTTDEINAAELMQEFHLENFDPVLNAAQLMQQFDWYDGYHGLQIM